MAVEQLAQLLDGLILTARSSGKNGAPIGCGIALPRRETAIPFAGSCGRLRIDPVEIIENGGYRPAEAVNVQPPEPDPLIGRQRPVMSPQPVDEVENFGIAPHPCREPRERFFLRGASRTASDVAVYEGGIGPVGLDRDNGKPMVLDEPFRDRRAGLVEFRGAMGRLSKEHDRSVSKAVEERAKSGRILEGWQRLARMAQQVDHFPSRAAADALSHARDGHPVLRTRT